MTRRRGHGDGSIYQRKDGRWAASFILPNGKRKYFYGKSKQEAKAKLRQAQMQVEQGTLVTAPQQTVKAHMEHWMQAKRLELKGGTYAYYRVNTEAYIVPALGHIQLQKLTDAHIQSFYTELLEDVSANTVRLIHSILRGALDAAVRSRKIASNPCKLVTLPREVKKELTFLSMEQARRLLEVARNHKLECLLTLALATGMRRGELLALRWSAIDFAKSTVHVIRSLSYRNPDGTGYEHKEEEPKTTSSKRTNPLPAFALEALQKHRVQQVAMRLKAPVWEDKGLVFPNDKGGYLWTDPVREQLKKLLLEAGLPVIRFYDLRHSAATILLAMGVNPKVIQERLGHSNISITLGVCGHVTESMQREAITKMNDHFQRLPGEQN